MAVRGRDRAREPCSATVVRGRDRVRELCSATVVRGRYQVRELCSVARCLRAEMFLRSEWWCAVFVVENVMRRGGWCKR